MLIVFFCSSIRFTFCCFVREITVSLFRFWKCMSTLDTKNRVRILACSRCERFSTNEFVHTFRSAHTVFRYFFSLQKTYFRTYRRFGVGKWHIHRIYSDLFHSISGARDFYATRLFVSVRRRRRRCDDEHNNGVRVISIVLIRLHDIGLRSTWNGTQHIPAAEPNSENVLTWQNEYKNRVFPSRT